MGDSGRQDKGAASEPAEKPKPGSFKGLNELAVVSMLFALGGSFFLCRYLVLGMMGLGRAALLLSPMFSALAVASGLIAFVQIRRRSGAPKGRRVAVAGTLLGVLNILVTVLCSA